MHLDTKKCSQASGSCHQGRAGHVCIHPDHPRALPPLPASCGMGKGGAQAPCVEPAVLRGCWGTMDSANQQQPGWAKAGGGRGELFCFFPRPGSGGGREGGEDRDAGQQARCSNAQSGSDVLFQQTRCLEPGMKVPHGAPSPPAIPHFP